MAKMVKAFLNKKTKDVKIRKLKNYGYVGTDTDLGNPALNRPFNITQNLNIIFSGGEVCPKP